MHSNLHSSSPARSHGWSTTASANIPIMWRNLVSDIFNFSLVACYALLFIVALVLYVRRFKKSIFNSTVFIVTFQLGVMSMCNLFHSTRTVHASSTRTFCAQINTLFYKLSHQMHLSLRINPIYLFKHSAPLTLASYHTRSYNHQHTRALLVPTVRGTYFGLSPFLEEDKIQLRNSIVFLVNTRCAPVVCGVCMRACVRVVRVALCEGVACSHWFQ